LLARDNDVVVHRAQQRTVELNLPGLVGTASHPDMQKSQIIVFVFENKLHCQFEVGKKIYKRLF